MLGLSRLFRLHKDNEGTAIVPVIIIDGLCSEMTHDNRANRERGAVSIHCADRIEHGRDELHHVTERLVAHGSARRC